MLPGFNHNIRHQGRVFHVQTEDNGLTDPRIVTQLFLEGHVLAVERSGYADLVQGQQAHRERLRERMQGQHKNMLKKLVEGGFDGLLAGFTPAPAPASHPVDLALGAAILAGAELAPVAEAAWANVLPRAHSSPGPRTSILRPDISFPEEIEDIPLDDLVDNLEEWEGPTTAEPPAAPPARRVSSTTQDTLVDVRLPAALRAAQQRLKAQALGQEPPQPNIRKVAMRPMVAKERDSRDRARTVQDKAPPRRGPPKIPSNDQTMLEIDPAALKAAMDRQRARLEKQKKSGSGKPIVVSEPSLDDVIMNYLKDDDT
ncbi:MAG: hypothetical protein AAGD10_16525 [Myxococcota bacterium]